MFTFVTGGLQAGKSAYAMRRAAEQGPPPWLYLAPKVEDSAAMQARLAQFRRDPEAIWRIKDLSPRIDDALLADVVEGHGAIVLDRFSSWLSASIAATSASGEASLLASVERLADRLYRSPVHCVLVSTEVGLGFFPSAAPERRVVTLLGQANQVLAERATSVVLVVSGIPQRLR
jgi:adenosylcobinamide kinase/adenosylcobinamide-phosphate guanylyltransferase